MVKLRELLVGLVLMLGLGAGPVAAQEPSALRSLATADDSRGWSAVGRLNFANGSFCTGTLIGPQSVLTAAHCLVDAQSGVQQGPGDITFLANWRNGRAEAYRGVRRAVVHPGYDPAGEGVSQMANDLALIELDRPIRASEVRPFGIGQQPLQGAQVGVLSYAHDRADRPALQDTCHVLTRRSEALVMTCGVDYGSSGSPVFVLRDGAPQIVSVVSAKAMLQDRPVSIGTALEAPLTLMQAIMAETDSVRHDGRAKIRRITADQDRAAGSAKFLRP
ncbi:hypothetical protein LCGC14_1678020 [marine sediment metagenome]|uniref:Peptidase S1 domain-containing protein n=1 Tax=marine sediment metagenome TaxID=412755 RepID=A0A0F9K551_9ZZZZ